MDQKQKEEDLQRQVLLAEQRREEERLLKEEREREEQERVKAVEGELVSLYQKSPAILILSQARELKVSTKA